MDKFYFRISFMKNNTKNLIIAVAASVVLAGGSGFFAGTKYQQSKTVASTRSPFAASFGPGSRNNRTGNTQTQPNSGTANNGTNRTNNMGFRPVLGEITNSDDKSITVKMTDGSSKIILISDLTSINKAETASKIDLTVGTTVSVFGQTNSDGSVTAQNIQLNPINMGQGENPTGMPGEVQPTMDGQNPPPGQTE